MMALAKEWGQFVRTVMTRRALVKQRLSHSPSFSRGDSPLVRKASSLSLPHDFGDVGRQSSSAVVRDEPMSGAGEKLVALEVIATATVGILRMILAFPAASDSIRV